VGLRQNLGKINKVTGTSAGLTTSATAYASGDQLGTEITLSTAGVSSGLIYGAQVVDKADVVVATGLELWLFSAATTPAADNAANSWSDADMANLVAVVPCTALYNSGLNTIVTTNPAATCQIPFVASGALYCNIVTRGANSFFGAVGDLLVTVYIKPDA
jgi:hypothetical protein